MSPVSRAHTRGGRQVLAHLTLSDRERERDLAYLIRSSVLSLPPYPLRAALTELTPTLGAAYTNIEANASLCLGGAESNE